MSAYLIADSPDGMLVIHSLPVTLSLIPLDVLNKAYNVGGIVVIGSYDNAETAKAVAAAEHSVAPADWRSTDVWPFSAESSVPTELHTPEIDGHRIVRHGIHWKE